MADDLATRLQHWEKMAELQVKLIEVVGKHKLDVAKAEVVKAAAAQEWAIANMKARVAQELESALGRMKQIRRDAEKHIAQIKNAASRMLFIRKGEELDPDNVAHIWVGFSFFQNLVPQSTLDSLMDTPLEDASRRGTSYSYNRDKSVVCDDVPADVENVLMLVSWLKSRRYLPRVGTKAYRQVTQAFSVIAGAADTEIEKLNQIAKKIETGTYKTWNPLALAALPSSVDVKAIINAGVTN